MFDTILIGTSSLLGHEKGLRVVGNNLANVNTAGFKSSQLGFSALFDQQAAAGQGGQGLETGASVINFQAGLDQTTGAPTDVAISGNGFFIVKRGTELLYTRAGDFHVNDTGTLVNTAGDKVQGYDTHGVLGDITFDSQARSMPKATTAVKFAGNVTTTVAAPPVDVTAANITVIDPNGGSHALALALHNNGNGDFGATVTDGTTTVGTGTIKFGAGFPLPGSSSFSFSYAPAGVAAFSVKFDFSNDVTALAGASTLALGSQDGYAAGTQSDQTIGTDGVITLKYSNGQSAAGPTIALADFHTQDDLEEAGASAFRAKDGATAQLGKPTLGTFGKLQTGHREGSNVDLAEEFSNLILMQRGYQAASHVVSTANDMIQELFDMKGNR